MPIHDWTQTFAGLYHDFHVAWIGELRTALNDLLPESYYALAEQKMGPFGPDVLTLQANDADEDVDELDGGFASGGTALALAPPKVRYAFQADELDYLDKPRVVAIRHGSDDRLIAIIELVSPGNKSNRRAIDAFVDKATECLDEGIHLLIVDLFPPTPRDPDGLHPLIWGGAEPTWSATVDEPLLLASYVAGSPRRSFVEPTAVGREPIDMPLFLTPETYIDVPLAVTYEEAFRGMPKKWKKVLDAGGAVA